MRACLGGTTEAKSVGDAEEVDSDALVHELAKSATTPTTNVRASSSLTLGVCLAGGGL
jgi:hypothetical protein